VRSAEKIPGARNHFVPCHPMAGKEKSGVWAAERGLYRNRIIFITPLKKSPPGLVRSACDFWRQVGGKPVLVGVQEHDEIVALTSHLPHLLASVLIHQYDRRALQKPKTRLGVGSGFRDSTRIAAGNPAMWADILLYNRSAILSSLRPFRRELALLEKRLIQGKKNEWTRFFEKARSIREKL
jgi:prephenate dehydrogenase